MRFSCVWLLYITFWWHHHNGDASWVRVVLEQCCLHYHMEISRHFNYICCSEYLSISPLPPLSVANDRVSLQASYASYNGVILSGREKVFKLVTDCQQMEDLVHFYKQY